MSSHAGDLRVTLKVIADERRTLPEQLHRALCFSQANDLNTKQQWVIRIRELIQENDLYHDLTMHESNAKPSTTATMSTKISQMIQSNNNQSDR